MKQLNTIWLVRDGFLTIFLAAILISCDNSSSPEGRMTMKIENLQEEMIDSLMKQNRAILDSLGKIREDLKELQNLKR